MIGCIIVIVVGYLAANSHSTAISASGRSSSDSDSNKTNFNGNEILRDGDIRQDIGFRATMKGHKKEINGNDDGYNTNNLNNGNDAHSADNIANNLNGIDGSGADDEPSDFVSIEIDDQLTLKDQMRMLTQQMSKRFQHELRAAVRKTTKDLFKADFQAQFEQLR